ncbi:BRCA1-associated 2 [Arabidopsis thaliana x Arabidopsis arenosa]|uniref:BRCA1-associated 2 n=1 Tax=Arabidopsis thaliana x Arabidopsis arenosa TaxID=1240361 RepID=A0A8T2ABM3_9BRAS|nr:BRCA1-associated 2 [Arabidopsis thaliana x Arabidopsis arenosa]
MFILRVHSVDSELPVSIEEEESGFTYASKRTQPPLKLIQPSLKLTERKGLIHLYRNSSHSSLPNPSSRSTTLFIVAVPNYMSSLDFIRFCDSRISQVSDILFIRNDGMEDRYSVLITLSDQSEADGFYNNLNGKKFAPSEAEVCHILYVISVEHTEFDEVAAEAPTGFTELPTCPICLERLDPDTSGIVSTLCDHSFQCSCTSKWTYLSCQVCRLCQQQDEILSCSVCGKTENVWACLVCGFLGCGRYKEGHSIRHWKETHHCYSFDLRTQQIWDYVGDSYVHRLNHSKIDGKSVEMNTRCLSHEGDCGLCECSEDTGISGAIFNSKVDSIVIEYNDLLASQLKGQRQYYESLIVEARSKQETCIAEAVEQIVVNKMQELQNEIEKCEEEKSGITEVNRKLIKEQETWRKKAKETEEREAALLGSKDEMIADLQEQIRDITVFIEAKKTLKKMSSDSDGIREGTVLPVPINAEPVSSVRRQKKPNRRK